MQPRSVFLMLALGALGAVLSVTFLLMLPIDGAPLGYNQLIAQELPVLIFAVGTGFGMGALIAVIWSIVQRLFAADVPSA